MFTSSRIPFLIVGILVLTSAFLMRNVSIGESAIMDEVAHIPAGYGYVKYLDHRLNPEHPPLIKALSGIFLLGLNPQFPIAQKSWTDEVNSQWDAGREFLYSSGNDPDSIVQYARLAAILITILTIILLYILGVELLGRWWALLPAALFTLSPSILAHGHLVTTDVVAGFGLLLSTFLFIRWIQKPSRTTLVAAGIGFGVAQLSKFSLVLVVPFFIISLAMFLFADWLRKRNHVHETNEVMPTPQKVWRRIGGLILIFFIGYLLVYVVYAVFVTNYPHAKQIADAETILQNYKPRFIVDAVIGITKVSFLRPFGEYILGFFMTLQRSAGGNTGYFLGDTSNFGWWYYFPTVFFLKESLPALAFILISIFVGIRIAVKRRMDGTRRLWKRFLEYLGTHFPECAIAFFILMYWVYSMQSPLNIGFRHVIPTIPLVYLLVAHGIKHWFGIPGGKGIKIFRVGLILVLIAWCVAETAIAYPYFISYFNEFGGGTMNGYRYVTDSNYDWGQDLKRLAEFTRAHNISKIAVDYFGGGDPGYYLGYNVVENWWSARGNPKDQGVEWLAVSVNTLQGAFGHLGGTVKRNPEDEYRWITELRPPHAGLGQVPTPDFRVGTSIFIYHL